MDKFRQIMALMPPRTRKIIVSLLGGVILLIGVVMIPYPGPGWLVLFLGLAVLSQEFTWAQRALDYGRDKYRAWNIWIKKQNRFVQSLTFIATTIVVVLTIWLINGYGLINGWFNLGLDWLKSPFVK